MPTVLGVKAVPMVKTVDKEANQKVYWYRVDPWRYSPNYTFEEDEPVSWAFYLLSKPSPLHLYKFEVLKTTPKGVWLWAHGMKRFVLNEGRKKYAHAKPFDAYHSFVARRTKRSKILRAQLKENEAILKTAKRQLQLVAK
jgi:hypothetical protein